MRYIRFLKSPRLEGRQLKTVVTLTSDLGDDCMHAACQLLPTLTVYRNGKQVSQIALPASTWSPGDHAVSITHTLNQRIIRGAGDQATTFDLTISMVNDESETQSLCTRLPTSLDRTGDADSFPQVLSVTSSLFAHDKAREARSKRAFVAADGSMFSIWETNGDSIEGHIWDAGLAAIVFFNHILASHLSLNAQHGNTHLHQADSTQQQPLSILELGCGTGILGLFLASTLPNSAITLTDLAPATDLIQSNITTLHPLAPGSSAHFTVLEWGNHTLPSSISREKQWDLVVASDINYNPDNAGSLVRSIELVSAHSPEVMVLVASKKRHQSEDVFGALMGRDGYAVHQTFAVGLPTERCLAGEEVVSIRTQEEARAEEDARCDFVYFTSFVKGVSGRVGDRVRYHALADLWDRDKQWAS